MQDLDDPTRFVERYQTSTWLDHLRQAQRATLADREVRERVLALHRGGQAPRIRHFLGRAPGITLPGSAADAGLPLNDDLRGRAAMVSGERDDHPPDPLD